MELKPYYCNGLEVVWPIRLLNSMLNMEKLKGSSRGRSIILNREGDAV
jgi:hypothetical protein